MLKNPHTIREEQGMKFPVLWLSFDMYRRVQGRDMHRMDIESRLYIAEHFCAKLD